MKTRIPSIPAPSLATAEAHAVACWTALSRHARIAYGCACHHNQYGTVIPAAGCEVGQRLSDEYQLACHAVRELQIGKRVNVIRHPLAAIHSA